MYITKNCFHKEWINVNLQVRQFRDSKKNTTEEENEIREVSNDIIKVKNPTEDAYSLLVSGYEQSQSSQNRTRGES